MSFVPSIFRFLFDYHEDVELADARKFDGIYERQQHSWDCGIACCTMVLRWANVTNKTPLLFEKTTPLWTVDLFCFLQSRGVDCTMHTTCQGINKDHFGIAWYQHNDISSDVERVQKKFALALEHDWPVQGPITLSDLLQLLATKGDGQDSRMVALALVDNTTMSGKIAEGSNSSSYSGHYVLLVGYDTDTDLVKYLDPASSSLPKTTSSALLDRARRHPGTDEDIIMCRKKSREESS